MRCKNPPELQRCKSWGKPAFRWGDTGTPFQYVTGDAKSILRARAKAIREGRALREAGMGMRESLIE